MTRAISSGRRCNTGSRRPMRTRRSCSRCWPTAPHTRPPQPRSALIDELRRREAAHSAILYAFDVIEHDGEDLRGHPFLDRKAALARLLLDAEAGISWSTSTSPRTARRCSSTLAGLVPRASCRSGSTAPIGPVGARSGSRFAIRPASRCNGSAARIGTGDPDPPEALSK
jgi:hypothetical protein